METNVIFLLKFGDKENIEKLFEKGEIYMNTISLFRNFDKKEVGDIYEGVFRIKNYKNSKITLKLPKKDLLLNSKELQLRFNYKDHVGNIYSTYAIHDKLLRRKQVHKLDKKMLVFGKYCLLINDVNRFLELILDYFKKNNINYNHNLVSYFDYSKKDLELNLYCKSKKYSYQKEHRIIAYTQLDEPLKFEIGNMSEFAQIYKSEDVINSMRLKFNK